MAFSPKSIQEKIKQEKLAEQMRRGDELRLQREKVAEQRRLDSAFYGDIGRTMLEKAMDGETSATIPTGLIDQYKEQLSEGGFDPYEAEIITEREFIDTYPQFKRKYKSYLVYKSPQLTSALLSNIYKYKFACEDDVDTPSDEQMVARAISQILVAYFRDGIPPDADEFQRVTALTSLLKYFDVSVKDLIDEQPGVFVTLEVLYGDILNTMDRERYLAGKPDKVISMSVVDWDDATDDEETDEAGKPEFNANYPFLSLYFLRWLASDAGKEFTTLAFLVIEESMAASSNACTLEFEEKADPPISTSYRLSFKGSMLDAGVTIEKIESMFQCLGYKTAVDYLDIKLSWKKIAA